MLEYAAIYPETLALLKRYAEAQRCRLYEAMVAYAVYGEEPDWPEDAPEWFVWEALKQQIDRARAKSVQNKANGSKAKRTEAKPSEPERTEAKMTKENKKEKEIIEDDDTARMRETPFGPVELDPVIISIQENLIAMAMQHYDDLEGYRDILPDDLIIEAVNEAVAHGARTWAYVRSILQGYVRDNVRTVGEARARAEKAKKATQGGKQVTAQMYSQRTYTESELESRVDEL